MLPDRLVHYALVPSAALLPPVLRAHWCRSACDADNWHGIACSSSRTRAPIGCPLNRRAIDLVREFGRRLHCIFDSNVFTLGVGRTHRGNCRRHGKPVTSTRSDITPRTTRKTRDPFSNGGRAPRSSEFNVERTIPSVLQFPDHLGEPMAKPSDRIVRPTGSRLWLRASEVVISLDRSRIRENSVGWPFDLNSCEFSYA